MTPEGFFFNTITSVFYIYIRGAVLRLGGAREGGRPRARSRADHEARAVEHARAAAELGLRQTHSTDGVITARYGVLERLMGGSEVT